MIQPDIDYCILKGLDCSGVGKYAIKVDTLTPSPFGSQDDYISRLRSRLQVLPNVIINIIIVVLL